MNNTDQPLLEQAILRTLAYYDVFDFPLQADEVWRWLFRGAGETWMVTPTELKQALEQMSNQKQIGHMSGWYFLPGREEIVAQRGERKVRGEKKWRRAKSAARFLEIVPFVKMVAVVNTLAIDNARPESDIDVLVVTSPGRIWAARMMVTGIVNMLGFRRHDNLIKDRVCLSFYLTTNALDLTPLKLIPDDPYLNFWAPQVVPLLDDKMYEKFAAANKWTMERLPNAWQYPWQTRVLKPQRVLRSIKHFYERIFLTNPGLYLESWARDDQIKRIDSKVHSKAKLGTTEVVISEDVLKFHEDDRRARYNAAFREKCEKLGITV